ncbi:MAG: biopolymer transporter ExbD, partial [Candidatus Caldatribacterium sp.]|nr:biopolymer transporter ExbD [Candidatus Caldatribacterium sp.]
LRKDPQVTVVIEADREVLHGKVVKLMDLLKRAGVERMAIATQPGEEEESDFKEGFAGHSCPLSLGVFLGKFSDFRGKPSSCSFPSFCPSK